MFNKVCEFLWNSPTFTTWASFTTRTLNLILILPLILIIFSVEEIALWQVFASIISLQVVLDLGFGYTFSRLFAYGTSGRENLNNLSVIDFDNVANEPNWLLLSRILGVTRYLYQRLSWVLLFSMIILGTFSLVTRISELSDTSAIGDVVNSTTTQMSAWIAWGYIITVSTINFRICYFSGFLTGTNHVALSRRWEAIFGIGAIITNFVVLVSGGGLLFLVISTQTWMLLSALRNRYLAHRIFNGKFKKTPAALLDKDILKVAWSPAWRTALGSIMSTGVMQVSGIIYAQSKDSYSVAVYLLGIRLIQTVSQVSQAPYYSKLPSMAQLWSKGKVDSEIRLAQRGMLFSYWAFVVPFVILGFSGDYIFTLIGSKTPFPSNVFWNLLGIAFFCERYGAMHLHLYGTTNMVKLHIANGINGIIFISVAIFLYPRYGVLALPIGMIAGFLGFYSWFGSYLSYRTFSLKWPLFDYKTVFYPCMFMIVYLLFNTIPS